MSEKQPTDDGGPAYPWQVKDHLEALGEVTREQGNGMTLLDWFAGQIASGYESNADDQVFPDSGTHTLVEWRAELDQQVSEYCYRRATAMIAEKRRREMKGGE